VCLVKDRKIESVVDLRDKSDGDSIRIVIELRYLLVDVFRDCLFKKPPLHTDFVSNFLVFFPGCERRDPKVLMGVIARSVKFVFFSRALLG